MTDRIPKSEIAVFLELAHEDPALVKALKGSGIKNSIVKEIALPNYNAVIYEAKDVTFSTSVIPNSMRVGVSGFVGASVDNIG